MARKLHKSLNFSLIYTHLNGHEFTWIWWSNYWGELEASVFDLVVKIPERSVTRATHKDAALNLWITLSQNSSDSWLVFTNLFDLFFFEPHTHTFSRVKQFVNFIFRSKLVSQPSSSYGSNPVLSSLYTSRTIFHCFWVFRELAIIEPVYFRKHITCFDCSTTPLECLLLLATNLSTSIVNLLVASLLGLIH